MAKMSKEQLEKIDRESLTGQALSKSKEQMMGQLDGKEARDRLARQGIVEKKLTEKDLGVWD